MSSANSSSSSSSSSSSAATQPKTSKANRKYRFYREDFGALVVRPYHLDLYFDVLPSRVSVVARTTFLHSSSATSDLTELTLSSKDLKVVSVHQVNGFAPVSLSSSSSSSGDSSQLVSHVASFADAKLDKLDFELDPDEHTLIIKLNAPVKPGEQFVVQTVSVATPTAHILEGLYYDYTPADKPQTIITQCQQYGFERIVPCIDTMSAKAFYTTTIRADKKYSNVLTNGDLAPGYFDSNFNPVYSNHTLDAVSNATFNFEKDVPADVERHTLRYHNHSVPMAPYLFFLGVGSYVTYKKELEYPSGHTCEIQLLVFPGLVEEKHAKSAINSLYQSILWVHLFTGPEAYDHPEEQKKILKLIEERDQIKASLGSSSSSSLSALSASSSRLSSIRDELKSLISVWKRTGHTYMGQFYREIAMQNSDYGGMENVGNTTIMSSRLVPSDLMPDAAYLYMEAVKVHEFFHDLNGSKVTGQSPFEIWLNEAVTVHIERMRSANMFGEDFLRLKDVIYSKVPGQGPLANDRSPNALAVEPEGFNRTQELISGMTYFKAPEFVRMIELVLGKPTFMRGLDHYYQKFAWANATTEQWIESMETVSGLSLKPMREKWLQRTGYPDVTYRTSYDEAKREYTLQMTQTGFNAAGPYEIPVSWALVKDGVNIKEGLYIFKEEKSDFVISDVAQKPDFISFARGWSFYGTSKNVSASVDELVLQARTDPDTVNRYLAYRHIADVEKQQIIISLRDKRSDASVSAALVELHSALLFDASLTPGTRALMLRESEDISMFPELSHHYQLISDAKDAILQAVYDVHAEALVAEFLKLQKENRAGEHKEQLHQRAIKHHIFNVIVAGHKPTVLATRKPSAVKVDISELSLSLIESSFMTDKLFGFAHYMQGPASLTSKDEVLSRVRTSFSTHPDSIDMFINTIAALDSDDAPRYIRALIQDEKQKGGIFNVNQSTHQRGVAAGWATNRKRSLLTKEGRALLVDLFVLIGVVNQYSAQTFINAFSDFPKFTGSTRDELIVTLKSMRDQIDPKAQQSLYNQLKTLLGDN